MTQRIIIDGIIFNVEPVGHEILKAYLDTWKQYNSNEIKQWEELVAEHLLQQLNGHSTVTTLSHVQGIHKVLPAKPLKINRRPVNSGRKRYLANLVLNLW